MSTCLSVKSIVVWLLSIDPVALSIGPLQVHWYALAYVVSVLFCYFYIGHLGGYLPEKKECLESIISWSIIGTIIGGRATYTLLYHPEFYLRHPLEIPKIWHGGMAFHGGLLGALVSLSLLCRRHKIPVLPFLDLCACSIPFGFFWGRIANLINGELYGRVTNICLGVVFPNSGVPLPRHPSQIYEAILEGLIPLILAYILHQFTNIKKYPGVLLCASCIWYGVCRCVVEIFREPDAHIETIVEVWGITMGQILSVLMVVATISLLAALVVQYRKVHPSS